MIVLNVFQDFLTWLGIRPIADQNSRVKQRIYYALGLLLLIYSTLVIAGFLTFIIKTFSVNFTAALYALVSAGAMFKGILKIVSAMVYRGRINAILDKLQNIYDQGIFFSNAFLKF